MNPRMDGYDFSLKPLTNQRDQVRQCRETKHGPDSEKLYGRFVLQRRGAVAACCRVCRQILIQLISPSTKRRPRWIY